MKLSIDYCIWHNKNIPAIYLQVYDFFSFFSFRRNITFDKIYIQRKIEGKYAKVAEVIVNSKNFGDCNNTERNSIIIDDCRKNFGNLFKCVAQRRSQKTGKRAHSLPMKNFYHVH